MSSSTQNIDAPHSPQYILPYFDQLPTELISKIFMIYASDIDQMGSRSLLNLGAVCRRWREIAWSMPDIWSKVFISIVMGGRRGVLPEVFWDLIDEWLDRAQERPLDICARFQCSEDEDTVDLELHHGKRLVDILNQRSQQWSYLDLALPNALIPRLGSPACASSQLHTLKILGDDDLRSSVTTSLTQHTPRIVEISGVDLDPISINWTSVVDVNLPFSSRLDHVLELLLIAPQIISCNFSAIGSRFGGASAAQSPVIHHAIEELFVTFSDQGSEAVFMNVATFPNLKRLSIGAEIDLNPRRLRTFLARSACVLTSLSFTETNYCDNLALEHFVPLLFDLYALERLYITNMWPIRTNFLDAFRIALTAHLDGFGGSGLGLHGISTSQLIRGRPILPSLRVFSWEGMAPFPWEIIPLFFVPLDTWHVNYCRPVQSISIRCQESAYRMENLRFIPRDILLRLAQAANQVDFDFVQQLDGQSYDCTSEQREVGRRPINPAAGASFHSLPVEVVAMAFKHYIDCARSFSKPHPSLTLGKICRRWRQIAWSTPHLWTELVIFHRHAMTPTHAELAREWLGRSSVHPLMIEFSNLCEEDEECEWEGVMSGCSQMLEALSECSDRWQSLTLIVPSYSLKTLTLLRPSPLLTHLSLDGRWDEDNPAFDFLPDSAIIPTFLNCTPKIVKIAYLKVDLNWTSVTDLTLDFVDIAEVLRVFRSASNLIKCTLLGVCNCGSDISALMEGGLIRCQSLESLAISFSDDGSPHIFCSSISLPALKHLSYDGQGIPLYVEDLELFLTQSSCVLKSLLINESEFEDGSLVDLAPFFSSLTELRILGGHYDSSGNDSDSLYQLLADPSQLSSNNALLSSTTLPYLPNLETFDWEGNMPYPWKTLPGLLKAAVPDAIPHRRPLKYVKIKCNVDEIPYIPKDILQQLLDFSDVKFELTTERNFKKIDAAPYVPQTAVRFFFRRHRLGLHIPPATTDATDTHLEERRKIQGLLLLNEALLPT
ncbi:hypothetical protein CVT26_004849 [Gymnopilus dilepis]|uniref:F-box domain-containing protein n=1 Tax=Gymnopilus dilepis TaxID=231916 RepID=A0A409YTT3_9AGAR|nr:hypothetical protein CVT26_004849 [Gymnopilus dilepis]